MRRLMKVLLLSEKHYALPHDWVACLLAQAGVQLHCVLRTGSPAVPFWREHGLTVEELPWRGRFDGASLRRLREILREFQPDIIHAYTGKTGWLAIWAQWPRKQAKLVFYRGATRYPSRWSPADWLLFYSNWVDAYECNCQGVAKSLVKGGVPCDKVAIVYYGHRLEWYANGAAPAALAQKSAAWRIGTVCNYRKCKGLETLVDAADMLAARGVDFEVVIVGRDDRQELARYVSRARCRDRVKLTGPIQNPWGVVRTFDCAVVPSLTEGLAKAALEALGCGVPVVASDVGGLREIIEHDVNGLLVPPAAPARLADAIVTVLEDPALRARLTAGGRRVLETKFSIDTTRDRLMALYHRVLDGRPPGDGLPEPGCPDRSL